MSSIDSAISSVLATNKSATDVQISFAIAAKQLKAQKQAGAAIVALLESAANLSKSLGKGNGFDGVG